MPHGVYSAGCCERSAKIDEQENRGLENNGPSHKGRKCRTIK